MRGHISAALTWAPDGGGDRAAGGGEQVGPWQVRLEAAEVVRAPGLTAALRGTLYGTTLGEVLARYRAHGAQVWRELDGSYALLLLDHRAGEVLAVTDRVGSHGLYAAQEGPRAVLSTRPDHPDFLARPLDVAGVASTLVNGALLGTLTLRAGVRALPRAGVHRLTPQGAESCGYWPLKLGAPRLRAPMGELRAEFDSLLRAAVARRVAASGERLHLALSGGYDSRGVLALLAASGREVRSFSYHVGAPAPDSDAGVAARLAAAFGVRHLLLAAYGGDLPAVLRRNARRGQGVTHFCDEADAWQALDAEAPGDLFTGEQAFELYHRPPANVGEQLARQRIGCGRHLGPLLPLLAPEVAGELQAALAAERARIVAALQAWEEPYQQELALMLDERVPRVLMPWREHFAGRAAQVHYPYLDAALLDFVHQLPHAALTDKLLVRQVLRGLDPRLSRVPTARTAGSVPDWQAELVRHRGALLHSLRTRPSALDALVPPEVIGALLEGLAPVAPAQERRSRWRQRLGRLRHSPAGRRVFGPTPLVAPAPGVPTLLLRLLTLRALDADPGAA